MIKFKQELIEFAWRRENTLFDRLTFKLALDGQRGGLGN